MLTKRLQPVVASKMLPSKMRRLFDLRAGHRSSKRRVVSLLSRLAVVLFLVFPEAVAAETVLGVPLPAFATKVAPFRFRSSQGARATAKALEKGLRGRGLQLEFRVLIDLPDVFALHATSSAPNAAFRGINVSEYGGSVWIFIISK